MNRTLSRITPAIFYFIAGLLCFAGTDWLIKTYIVRPDRIYVRGTVEYQQSFDPTASATPPNGYFVRSTATERFYLEDALVKPYKGTVIQADGTLTTVCGSDGGACYPKLKVEFIRPIPK